MRVYELLKELMESTAGDKVLVYCEDSEKTYTLTGEAECAEAQIIYQLREIKED